jgi:hypothetical protein
VSEPIVNISASNVTPPKRLLRATLNAIWECEKYTHVWAADCLGFKADGYQREFLDSEADSIILLWSRQLGKSSCAGIKAAHHARFSRKSQTLIISATQRQAGILQKMVLRALEDMAKGKAWQTVNELDLPEDPLDPDSRIVRCSVLSLELGNGSEVISVPASPDSIRGYSPSMLLVDEAARVPDTCFDALRPMRSAHPCKLFLLSTPAGRRGAFWRAWEGSEEWVRSRVTAEACMRVSKAFLERERLAMTSEAVFRQEYLCEFISLQGGVFSQKDMAAIMAGAGAWRLPTPGSRAGLEELVVAGKAWSL